MKRLCFHHAAVLVTLMLLYLTCPAHSEKRMAEPKDTFFIKDATVHVVMSGEAYIGFASADDYGSKNHPTSPTIRLVAGSSVATRLSAFNKSHVTISGGKIATKATAYDSSILTLSSGDVGEGVYAESSSTVNVSGGTIGDGVYAAGNSKVSLSGGSVKNGLYVSAHATVNYSGGKVDLLFSVNDSGTLKLIGKGLTKKAIKSESASGATITTYTLTGKLRDGTSVTGKTVLVQSKTGAKLILTNVP